jgi:hypothetical protein
MKNYLWFLWVIYYTAALLIICALGMFSSLIGLRSLDRWCEAQLNDI